MRSGGESFLKEEEALLFSERGFFRGTETNLFFGGLWEHGSNGKEKIGFWVLQNGFSFGAWLRRPGGQGGFRPPPYAPLDPLYPLQTAEGYPRTPLVPEGARPLASRLTGSVSYPTFGLAWGQQPIGCRGGYTPYMALVPGHVLLQGGPAVAAPCLHSKDKPAPRSRGRDQLRQAAFSPKANTRVAKRLGFHEVKANLEGDSGPPRDGREPSWARPCEASGAL